MAPVPSPTYPGTVVVPSKTSTSSGLVVTAAAGRVSGGIEMLAGAAGSMIIKYVNSSYFWVCMSLSRMSLKAALVSYGGVTFVNGVTAMAMVYLLWTIGWI